MATVQSVKNQVATRQVRPMSPAVAEVRTNINLMVEVMKSCMVKDMHFGVIPGVQKPSLFKAGAEKIMATFRLSANPVVEDLSKDGEIRFRVRVEINAKDGSFVGAGIGECSSQEEKFMWRVAVCQEEFDITEEAKRRIKFKKSYNGPVDKISQVRCNPSDLANTILKMAKKRALVDGVLTATGASDLFSQDIEDLPAEYIESHKTAADTHIVPQPKPEPAQEATKAPETAQDTPKQEEAVKTPPALEGDSIMGVYKSRKIRPVKGKDGKAKDMTDWTVDVNGNILMISQFGGHDEYPADTVLIFSGIKTSEWQGKTQYLAGRVQTTEECWNE